MHKIIVDNDSIILQNENYLDIEKNRDVTLYLFGEGKTIINVLEDCKLTVYHLGVDISNDIQINLNGKNSEVKYYYSVVNYQDNVLKIVINHNSSNTYSNVYNHGVNVLDKSLRFEVSGVVPKNILGCSCNQENRIINMSNGKSMICPNLLIDYFDVSSSHAAYIGKFSDDVLFYLMSRGISREKSYSLLIKSFLVPTDIDKEKVEDFMVNIENI